MKPLIEPIINDYNKWTSVEKKIIDKIIQNDAPYLERHLDKINDQSKKEACVRIAVCYSNDTKVIDMLILRFKIDISGQTTVYLIDGTEEYEDRPYYLNLALRYNNNLDFIKHLIDRYNLDPLSTQYEDFDCLYDAVDGVACFDVIKYLVEEKSMVLENCMPQYTEVGTDYLHAILRKDQPNIELVAYMINRISLDAVKSETRSLETIPYNNFKTLLFLVINKPDFIINENNCHFLKINMLIKMYSLYLCSDEDGFASIINPLVISENQWKYLNIQDPFEKDFNEFRQHVDSLLFCVNMPKFISKYAISRPNNAEEKVYDRRVSQSLIVDRSKPSQELFKHNGETYYGDRKIVYGSMLFLNDIIDSCDLSETIELSGNSRLPVYAINAYIDSSYTGQFDLRIIDPADIDQFIQFINQYPTSVVSIDLMENMIINYFDSNKITISQSMKEIFVRYRLKCLYLYMHNKSLMGIS